MTHTEGGDRVIRNNIGSHQGIVDNPLSFCEAYQMLSNNPSRQYRTTGNRRVFVAQARRAVQGNHPGERVIVFHSNDTERARAYKCCWGHRTNCNHTYIDCYTEAINRSSK